MLKHLTVWLTIFLFSIPSFSQKSRETAFKVIIDTDCGIDDARAIAYLLSRYEVEIKACIVSEGNLAVEDGISKIYSLLGEFQRDSIPVAAGVPIAITPPAWREFNKSVLWGNLINRQAVKAPELLSNLLANSGHRYVYIALGPLTNLARLASSQPHLVKKIEKVIWYTNAVSPLSGFNYACDPNAAETILASGLRVDVVSNLKQANAIFDLPLHNLAKRTANTVSTVVSNIHSQPDVFNALTNNHFKLWDDLAAVYLFTPELFDMEILPGNKHVRYAKRYNGQAVREVISDILTGNYSMEKNIVFNSFPTRHDLFNYDIRPMIDSIMIKHGNDEWKACVITDEFHGHLGVFSIVGAKMGIKAREYFGVGPDQLIVTSFAGSKPPYSCLTDGIQVSTGATLGMGTIKVAAGSAPKPAAIFSFKDKSIEISLKDEYLKMVETDINEGIVKYGLIDDGYWKLIRRNAIKYWHNWHRDTIFTIKEIK